MTKYKGNINFKKRHKITPQKNDSWALSRDSELPEREEQEQEQEQEEDQEEEQEQEEDQEEEQEKSNKNKNKENTKKTLKIEKNSFLWTNSSPL